MGLELRKFRGQVEQYNPQVGVVGWAIGSDGSDEPAKVELVAGRVTLASERARIFRPDLRAPGTRKATLEPWVGFRFAPPILALAACLGPEDRKKKLRVRDAGSGAFLLGADLPTGEELAALISEAEEKSPLAIAAFPDEPRTARELLRMMEAFRFDASALTLAPTAFPVQAHKGHIEVVFRIGRGLFVIGGWTFGAVPRQGPALILLDGRKLAASVFCAPYKRPDLPVDAVAFCALLRTDAHLWRGDQDFILTFGESDRLMRSRRPFKFLKPAPGLAWLTNATKAEVTDKELITQIMRMRTEGAVTPEVIGGYASLDRVTIFPGFGALVRGWVLSPQGDLATVSVTKGAAQADATPERIIKVSRPDLGAGVPSLADRTAHAGFTALCLGTLSEEHDQPAVQVGLDDGTSLIVSGSAQVLRSGFSAETLDDLATHFPAYVGEAFFPDLCRAIANTLNRQKPRLHYLRRSQGTEMILFGMPVSPADARLALTDIARGSLERRGDLAISLLLGPDHDRSAVTRAVRDVLPDAEIGMVQHDGHATLAHTLSQIFADMGVERFLFVRSGSRLSWPAWKRATGFVRSGAADRPLVYTDDHARSWSPTLRVAGALCWNAPDFADFGRRAIPVLDCASLGCELSALPGAKVVGKMIGRYHGRKASSLTVRIERDVETFLWRSRSS